MIIDADKILEAVAIANIKSTLATLVWDMQLENSNAEILNHVAEDILPRLDKLSDPTDVHNASWQEALEKECSRFLTEDTKPALSIVPWLDKITGPDISHIAHMAFGGMRHSPLHVRSAIVLIRDKIERGTVLSKITTSGNMKGSLPWYIVAKEINKGAPDAKIIEHLRIAIGYEVEVQYR